LLNKNNYQWYRVSYNNLFQKLGLKSRNITGRVFYYKNILLLENHHNGFGNEVAEHILSTNYDTYTLTAHPLMFDFENKLENEYNFIAMIQRLMKSGQRIEFVRPMDLLDRG
jgi:hypothetical protein